MRRRRHRGRRRGPGRGLKPAVGAIAALGVLGCSSPAAALPSPAPSPARLIAVAGTVTTVAGKTQAPAEIGQQVPAGGTVVSSPGAVATIALPNGIAITIAGDSSFRYGPGGGGGTGELDAMAPPGRELRLTAGLADIRGTGPLEVRASAPMATPRTTNVTAVAGGFDVRYRGGRTRLEQGRRLALVADAAGHVTPAVT